MENEELNLEELKGQLMDAITGKKTRALKEIFETIPTIDIAESIYDVDDVTVLLYIFRVIPSDYTADFFADLTNDQQELIVKSFSDKDLIKILENSFTDDIVDAIDEFPANLVNKVLRVAPKDLRQDINQLLKYKENTAGSLMTTEYIELLDTTTVEDAIKSIRKNGRDAETVYTIFVRDKTRTLVGTINLDDLIFAKEDETLEDIMDRDFVTCNVNDDQEDVGNMFKRYDLTAMAVVNNANKIIGIITVDDVVDIIVEEANEDALLLNQVSSMDEPYLETPVFKIVLKCLPWILVLMVLQVFSTMILSGFESKIASLTILSVFTPLIMDAGGNSGGQTTTMIVRSMSLDEFGKGDLKRVIWKELRVALCIAAAIAIFTFGWINLEMAIGVVKIDATVETFTLNGIANPEVWARLGVAGLVAGTLFVTMVISRMVGCFLPFIAKALKLDPAVMCGPLTTTIVDIVSLLTYFLIWTLVLAPQLGL
ncbi:MAG: magnesium transporter [Bacilli bacterium]|nr:magnesium transporter [Bacilli bacterium]